MLRPAPMVHWSVVVLERHERAVLRELGLLGAIQLTSAPAGPDPAPRPAPDCTHALARCDRLLARIETVRQALGIPRPTTKPPPTELTWPEAEVQLGRLEHLVAARHAQHQNLWAQRNVSDKIGAIVARYGGLGLPLGPEDEGGFLHVVTGHLPAANLPALASAVDASAALLPLPALEDDQPLVAFTTSSKWPALEKALRAAAFEPEPLPTVPDTTADRLDATLRTEREDLRAQLEQLAGEMNSLAASWAPTLAALESLARTERRLLEAAQTCARTEATTWVSGWVPADTAPALTSRVREITGGCCAFEAVPAESRPDEIVPVLLRHPSWLRPFGWLTRAYGMPNYREIEPTLFLALSYVPMFGMMFGDAGHGAVLVLAGWAMIRGTPPGPRQDLGRLLRYGGLSSLGFGVVYGSYFGIASCKHLALWQDPLEGDPLALMAVAVGTGVAMISLGLVLNVLNRFRRGDVLGGCLDRFGLAGIWFYWGALLLATQHATLETRGLTAWALLVLLGLPLLGWWLKEPIEYALRSRAGHPSQPGDGLLTALLESTVGTFEAVLSYLANTISFVRLAAYAMSHAALLVAAFMVADAVRRIPVAGDALGVLAIILGNLVALVLEGVIASVQSLRLEYYEFLGKFFRGDGQPFTPFCLKIVEPLAAQPAPTPFWRREPGVPAACSTGGIS